MPPSSLFEKIWRDHVIVTGDDGTDLIYVDRHFLHEGSRNGFELLKSRQLKVRRPDLTFGFADHLVPTRNQAAGLTAISDAESRTMAMSQVDNARREGFVLFGIDDPRQGIVHVVGPEQGLTLPGLTIVCGDSHTSTHGALGALAFGIGTSELSHVLATQTLWLRRPRSMVVDVDGELGRWVTSKDLILSLIGRIGAAGGTGYVIEYRGSTISAMTVEARMTISNMTIEAGARAGLIGPDDATIEFLRGRPFAPAGELWDPAVRAWRDLASEPGCAFDRQLSIDAAAIAPTVTWGTSPEHTAEVTGAVPAPGDFSEPSVQRRVERALDYMGLAPGTRIVDIAIDQVFIGSCTNSRIEDLRLAAQVVAGKKVVIPAMIVPGSRAVRAQAEAEGLADLFRAAGFDWREPGCSMCLGMNGDLLSAGTRCASTSNRNFEGRQGRGARTHLVSPAMAAAAAVTGRLVDVRELA